MSYPAEAGAPIGGPASSRYVMLEVHYNNPDRISGRSLRLSCPTRLDTRQAKCRCPCRYLQEKHFIAFGQVDFVSEIESWFYCVCRVLC